MCRILILYFIIKLIVKVKTLDWGMVDMDMDKDNYGAYTADFQSVSHCGEKEEFNISDTSAGLAHGKLNVNVTVFNPCVVSKHSKSKVTVKRLMSDNTKKTILRLKIDDPCTHFAVAPIINNFMKANEKCIVNKGFYTMTIDLMKITVSFLGETFFFGEFEFHTIIRCKTGTLSCLKINVEFRKKKNS